ncbi:MAG TPA: DUF6485 family protein [Patescibacteria group bacterium]|nr:DUF6485 family protein [Patescibacteria group bacterium]
MECKQKENLKNCPCTYAGCPRKGICCECLKYHLADEELPACYFSKEAEKTYDRSIKNFIRDKNSND